MNRKAVELTFGTIGVAVLMLVSIAVVLAVFSSSFGKERAVLSGQIDDICRDIDGDRLIGNADPCPCDANVEGVCRTPKDECEKRIAQRCG